MQAVITNGMLLVTRDEKDKPVVPAPYPRPAKLQPGEYNSWRKEYRMMFDSPEETQKALAKVISIGDFDKAAAWLDKQ